MNTLNYDIFLLIFSHLNSYDILSFSMTSYCFKNCFSHVISYFKFAIDLSHSQITNNGLKYFKDVHTINLKSCRQITDNGLIHLQ